MDKDSSQEEFNIFNELKDSGKQSHPDRPQNELNKIEEGLFQDLNGAIPLI